jgi:hypothetical protein
MGRRRSRVQHIGLEEERVKIQDCDGFRVLDDLVAYGRAITFLDRAGNPDHVVYHLTFEDRFYNSENPDRVVTGTAHSTTEVQLPEELETWRAGLHIHLMVPGVGLVYKDAGTLRYGTDGKVIFEGGQHPLFGDPQSLSPRERDLQRRFCEVLRAP